MKIEHRITWSSVFFLGIAVVLTAIVLVWELVQRQVFNILMFAVIMILAGQIYKLNKHIVEARNNGR